MHPCTHPCTLARMHPCEHATLHPCTHAPLHTCTHAPLHTCTHAPMHPCTHAPTCPKKDSMMRYTAGTRVELPTTSTLAMSVTATPAGGGAWGGGAQGFFECGVRGAAHHLNCHRDVGLSCFAFNAARPRKGPAPHTGHAPDASSAAWSGALKRSSSGADIASNASLQQRAFGKGFGKGSSCVHCRGEGVRGGQGKARQTCCGQKHTKARAHCTLGVH